DDAGALWIGDERGDLTRLERGKFTPMNYHELGTRRKIFASAQDDLGEVWSLNEEGTIIRSHDGRTCALPNTDGVAWLARDQDHHLWVASGGNLARLERGSLLTNDTRLYGSYIQGLCASQDGGLWVIGDDLVRKWRRGQVQENRGANPCHVTVTVMTELRSGTLAMGTSSDGLYLLAANGAVTHFSHTNGFPNDWIRCLAEDQEGTLWIGAGSSGIIALRPGYVQSLDAPDHWQGRVVLSVAQDRSGTLWVGSEGAGVYRIKDDQWQTYGTASGLSNLYVWSVTQDHRDRIWASTWGGGIFWLAEDKFVFPPGLENTTAPMAATLQTANGVTWIGTARGLLRYQNGQTEWYGENHGLKLPDVRCIAIAPDQSVWFGMIGGGLGHLSGQQVQQFQKADGLSSDYVQCLKFEADGSLWIGTYGGGLNYLADGKFTALTTKQGLPNDFICSLEADDQGKLWVSSHNGIFSAERAALLACARGQTNSVYCQSLGKGDGLTSLECSGGLQPASCRLNDGRIAFTTSRGLVLIDPPKTRPNTRPPPVLIEEFSAGDQVFSPLPSGPGQLIIPPGWQRFKITYTGLSFVAPEKIRFQYRLFGWENEWVEGSPVKRTVEYNYLPPGHYAFSVRACNNDGVWNDIPATLRFEVLPHFWQTWWFYLLTGLCLVGVVARTVWYISRRRMRRKLEDAQRQQAIERERTRIAKDIHDHLGANLTRISLLSQSAHGELENPKQAAVQLDRIYETTRDLTRAMDEIVWAVNPQHDTLDSLASYLGNFALDYLVPLQLRCRLDVPLHLPVWPISAEIRHNIFLAFKEALNNTVKYAEASEVIVGLETRPEGFTITLKDNGKGFDPNAIQPKPGRGSGLKNMLQRLEKIGGHCEIHSSAATGTEIKFHVPVKPR
ncbi:MAG TPA: two-component regulator propeller domain-containing protein, partial [Verrucomicrobiae bacterium]